MTNLIDLGNEDFKDFIISNMAVGQVDFWWQAYTILNGTPKKKLKQTPEAIKQRVKQWPKES